MKGASAEETEDNGWGFIFECCRRSWEAGESLCDLTQIVAIEVEFKY